MLTHARAVDDEDQPTSDITHALIGFSQGTPGSEGLVRNLDEPDLQDLANTDPSHFRGTPINRGYQEHPKELARAASYHVFTTSKCRRNKKSAQCAVALSVFIASAVPRWLKWSGQKITWSRSDHSPHVDSPGTLALVVAPQVYGYTLEKVLMDGGSSINILYFKTFQETSLT